MMRERGRQGEFPTTDAAAIDTAVTAATVTAVTVTVTVVTAAAVLVTAAAVTTVTVTVTAVTVAAVAAVAIAAATAVAGPAADFASCCPGAGELCPGPGGRRRATERDDGHWRRSVHRRVGVGAREEQLPQERESEGEMINEPSARALPARIRHV